MKTLDVTGMRGDEIAVLVETHWGWYASVKSPADHKPGSWEANHPRIVMTGRDIPITALRKLINYDFCIEGQLFNLASCGGETRADHGSGYPGDTGTTYIPEIRIVYQP